MGRTLVVDTLRGTRVPRPAVGPLAVHFCASRIGTPLRQYATDPAALAESVRRYYDHFAPDAIWVSADTWVTAEAMGAEVVCPGGNQPFCGSGRPHVQSLEDVKKLPPPDPYSQGRCGVVLAALASVRRSLGGETFIVACFDQYPFSVACALMGVEAALRAAVEDRVLLEAVMEKALQYAAAYAEAMAAAGADMLSGGDSPALLLGPLWYRELAMPFEKRVIQTLKERTGLPVSLHICGDTRKLLSAMAETGADVLELDWQVGLHEASRQLSPAVTVWGNLDTVSVLRQGTPELVARKTEELLRAALACGRRKLVVSSGCTIAVDTPEENLSALCHTARTFQGWDAG